MKKFILIALVLTACGKSLPTFDGVDLKKWRDDRRGCAGERKQIIPALSAQQEKLLGLSEADILTLLGRPDRNELWKRNQKFFQYIVSTAGDCNTGNPTVIFSIRFNAMERAKEIAIDSINGGQPTGFIPKDKLLPDDTTLNGVKIKFEKITKQQYDSLESYGVITPIPIEKVSTTIEKVGDCQLISLRNGKKDTLCDKKEESGYFETYSINGEWKEKNLLIANFQNWEEGGDFFISLTHDNRLALDNKYIVSRSKFDLYIF